MAGEDDLQSRLDATAYPREQVAMAYQPKPRAVRVATALAIGALVVQLLVTALSLLTPYVWSNAVGLAVLLVCTIPVATGRGAMRVPFAIVCLLPVPTLFWAMTQGLLPPVLTKGELVIDVLRFGPLLGAALLPFTPAANRWYAWHADCRRVMKNMR